MWPLPSALLVDDHAPMRATLRLWLADLAAPITECDNGLDVGACYAAHRPDWVLMDIQLPGQDGIAATRELIAANPSARVLIVTGYRDADVRRAAAAAGALGYVLKDNLPELREYLQHTNPANDTSQPDPREQKRTDR